jgi:solute carrier family 39 (zinc transporter), member 7
MVPCEQDTDIQACAPVRQLGALKEQLEEGESPVLRQVFAWLFPFGPAWNSGMCSEVGGVGFVG